MNSRIVWHVDVPKKIDDAGRQAQRKMIFNVLRFANPYTPKDTGNLIASGTASSLPEKGVIIYSAPYAKKLYYGDKFKFDRTKNRKAGSRWIERMKREHMKDIEKDAQVNFKEAYNK